MLHNVCDEFTYDDFGPDSLLVHDGRGFDAVARRLAASAFDGDAPSGAAENGDASAGAAPGGKRARLVLGTTVTSVEAAGAVDAPLAVRSRDGRTRLARRDHLCGRAPAGTARLHTAAARYDARRARRDTYGRLR